jgi:hypothetical protein
MSDVADRLERLPFCNVHRRLLFMGDLVTRSMPWTGRSWPSCCRDDGRAWYLQHRDGPKRVGDDVADVLFAADRPGLWNGAESVIVAPLLAEFVASDTGARSQAPWLASSRSVWSAQ